MFTVLEIIKKTTDFFATKGIESARLNAELLVGHALERKRMQLYLEFERLLGEAELEKIRPLARRRAQHEPLQYILGETEFCGLKLKVDRRALIPRPETEQLVEHVAVARASTPPARILDLGTGTGAIALALAQTFPAAEVVAVDRSEEALALARENAAHTGLYALTPSPASHAPSTPVAPNAAGRSRVSFIASDWFAAVPREPPFDAIVSNPPYLTAEEAAEAAPEVRGFEPAQALVAAEDGLADLLRIVADAPAWLAPGGLLALETGIAHHERLRAAAEAAGFAHSESKQDLTGRDRFVLAYGR